MTSNVVKDRLHDIRGSGFGQQVETHQGRERLGLGSSESGPRIV
ncbi:MAG: hypothetical protein V9G04_05880 [Nocardioides sp.]|jgi:hypothetical protein